MTQKRFGNLSGVANRAGIMFERPEGLTTESDPRTGRPRFWSGEYKNAPEKLVTGPPKPTHSCRPPASKPLVKEMTMEVTVHQELVSTVDQNWSEFFLSTQKQESRSPSITGFPSQCAK